LLHKVQCSDTIFAISGITSLGNTRNQKDKLTHNNMVHQLYTYL